MSVVSIIIPVYNGAEYLEKTVNTLLAQTYKQIEIILVDDGSKDASFKLMSKLAADDKRITIYHKDNGGVANARNFGIKKAKGEFIAFCDQDDLWHAQKLEKQVPLFKKPNVGLVYCGVTFDFLGKNTRTNKPINKDIRGFAFENLLQDNKISCCTVVARKSLIERVGYFDDDRELMGVDDWHLWLKLALNGEIDFVDEHLATHVLHGGNYSGNQNKMHAADLVCLTKVEQFSKQKNIDWNKIRAKVHSRYADTYLHFGMYELAAATYFASHRESNNLQVWVKAIALRFIPNRCWSLAQSFKRKLYNNKPSIK